MSANITDTLLGTSQVNFEEESHAEVINLDETIHVDDSTADANVPPRPPNRDKYPVAYKLNTNAAKSGGEIGDFIIPKGITVGMAGKDRRPFVGVYLTGQLRDESSEYNGFLVNYYCNSIKFAGNPTSQLHDLMNKAGTPLPNDALVREIVLKVQETFGDSEPVIMTELDWRCSYENPNFDSSSSESKTNKKYIEQCKTMTDFPRLDDGSYSNVVSSNRDGEPLYAQAYVKKIV